VFVEIRLFVFRSKIDHGAVSEQNSEIGREERKSDRHKELSAGKDHGLCGNCLARFLLLVFYLSLSVNNWFYI